MWPSLKRSPKPAPRAGSTSDNPLPRRRRDLPKPHAIEASEQQWPLRPCRSPILLVNDWKYVSVRNEDIEESVVVKVQKTSSPVQKWNGGFDQTRLISHVRKNSVPLVLE